MSAPLRIDLMGAGTIARQHAEAARASGREIELRAADPSAAARESFAAAFPGTTLFDDVRELLATPAREGDIAIVATPPWLHREVSELVRKGALGDPRSGPDRQ
jgi:predicted dehydrogenase